jgi:carotenoid 1,2-hydratase
MTERTKPAMYRDATQFSVGPSGLSCDGNKLVIDVNERSLPFAQKITGKITVYPETLFPFRYHLMPIKSIVGDQFLQALELK